MNRDLLALYQRVAPVKRSKKQVLKFIHTADLHLGSTFHGHAQYDDKTAQLLSNATYRAFKKIIELCIHEDVDFLLISGDIYDSQDKNIKAQLNFSQGLRQLDENGIRCIIVHGNHDPVSSWSKKVKLPESTIRFSCTEPEVHSYYSPNGKHLANIVGMSFETELVFANLSKYYPEKEKDWPFTIGLLHCNVGSIEGHDQYAPCNINDLKRCGYDYWALGHIHKPGVINEARPLVAYSGNPQGRDMGETGPRGCFLVTIDRSGSIKRKFIDTSSILWDKIQIDTGEIESLEDLDCLIREELSDLSYRQKKDIICRIELVGNNRIYDEIIDEDAIIEFTKNLNEEPVSSKNRVLVDKITNNTRPVIDREEVKERNDIVSDICTIVDEIPHSSEMLEQIKESVDDLYKNPKLRHLLQYPDDDELLSLISQAESFLLSRMVGGSP